MIRQYLLLDFTTIEEVNLKAQEGWKVVYTTMTPIDSKNMSLSVLMEKEVHSVLGS